MVSFLPCCLPSGFCNVRVDSAACCGEYLIIGTLKTGYRSAYISESLPWDRAISRLFRHIKPGPLGQVSGIWLCRWRYLLKSEVRNSNEHLIFGFVSYFDIRIYRGCQKNVPIEDRFSATNPYTAIIFSEHYYDKRYRIYYTMNVYNINPL